MGQQQPETTDHGGIGAQAGLSLLFAPGARPDADRIVQALHGARATGLAVQVSHRPGGEAPWLELLAGGLTFELHGLAPGPGGSVGEIVQRFGGEMDEAIAGEAVTLAPSDHIAAAAASPPVLKAMLGLAINLLELPVLAVAWRPAGTLIAPGHFARTVVNWLAGGPFPAAGLTALLPDRDGGVTSRGLAHFIGQEIQLEGSPGESEDTARQLACAAIDHLIAHGPLADPSRIGNGADALLAEPSMSGRRLYLWRDG